MQTTTPTPHLAASSAFPWGKKVGPREHLQPNTERAPFSKDPANFLKFTTKNPQEQNALPVIMQHALYLCG